MSALADHLESYLALRRALGYGLVPEGRLLERFVDHLDASGVSVLTTEVALAWATAPPPPSPGVVARRLSVIRRFAAHLSAFDERTEVPPTQLVASGRARTTPYLYSPDEITALMAAARRLRPPLWAASTEALIGLMAATGLRTGEARGLDRGDVDLDAGLLIVRASKFGKDRQVPPAPERHRRPRRLRPPAGRALPPANVAGVPPLGHWAAARSGAAEFDVPGAAGRDRHRRPAVASAAAAL